MADLSFSKLIKIVEAEQEYYQIPLPAKRDQFSPVFSEKSIDIHYGILYKNYVDKALSGDADDFQYGGAFLHTLLFEQIQPPKSSNIPTGPIKELIINKFGTYDKFQDKFIEIALKLEGSGWIYLDTKGEIKIIHNHKIVPNIAVLVDMFEHSYFLDFGANKKRYLSQVWKTVNWDIVNARLNNL